jgi:hypothetical protein
MKDKNLCTCQNACPDFFGGRNSMWISFSAVGYNGFPSVVFSVQGGGVVCYVIFIKVHSKQRYALIKIKAKPFF